MHLQKSFFWLAFLFCGLSPLLFSQQNVIDSKIATVDAFMNARMLEHNVAARNLMTARLENDYLRGKKLSVRIKSGRIISYDFDPSSLKPEEGQEFEIVVSTTCADLNEQVYGTQREKIKFTRLNNEWMADDINLIQKEPVPGLPPMDLENAKRIKFAVSVAKKFAKAVIKRDAPSLLQVTTQEYQRRFSNSQSMIDTLGSPRDFTYNAFGLKGYSVKNPEQIDFTMIYYQVSKGKRGHTLIEARVTTHQGSLDWLVEDCQFHLTTQ
jgi:hypothetical protein